MVKKRGKMQTIDNVFWTCTVYVR